MKKAISILLVLALSVSLFAIPVSASETLDHPLPPSYLCDCDNPIQEYWVDRYRAPQPDWSDDTHHHCLVYDVYECGNCYGYIYVRVEGMIYSELHEYDVDGVCSECGYER